jgi:hypothetical protein
MDAVAHIAAPMPPVIQGGAPLVRQATDILRIAAAPSKGPDIAVDVLAAEAARRAAVESAARQIANEYVISDMRFTIFKDASGQYITRFTSLRDGRVTYIPEPDLLRKARSQGAGTQPTAVNVSV